jgi:hypothetical protein
VRAAAVAGAKPVADADADQPDADADVDQPDADPDRHQPEPQPDPEPDLAESEPVPDRHEPESERLDLADPGHHRSVPVCQPIGLHIGKRES